MGLRVDMSLKDGPIFSEDVLKIEIHGPREDYLTIIDVPGIFRTTTQGTTKDDMAMVKELVRRYIKNERTIILAVLPSNVDIATQEILELAEEYDPSGDRTLGVLTKPDLVPESSAQAAVCDLIQGNIRPLSLGYFLVRNSGSNIGPSDPQDLDRIFQEQPWNELPRDRVGISALKEQLGLLLVEITRREFPKMLQDIGVEVRKCKKELDNLGPPRQDEREQRSFLSNIAGSFQDRARAALAADYNANPVFEDNALHLITRVANISDVFNADFQESAHSRHFEDLELSNHSLVSETDGDIEVEKPPIDRLTCSLRALLQEERVDDFSEKELTELDDIVVIPHPVSIPVENFSTWINEVYLKSRGLDLGTFNTNLISVAFAEQSRKWGDMTNIYMSKIIVTLHRFIAAALRSVCPEDTVRNQLWSAILTTLQERYKMAMDQAKLLVDVEQRRQPYTLDRQFTKSLSKAHGHRITELLRPKARLDSKQYGEKQWMVNLDDIAEAAQGMSNVDHLQQEIHDILYAYYTLSVNRFIDNIFQLAVDYSLLHGPSSPLNVFNQDWVINLEPEQLERIVGETKVAKKRRAKLAKKVKDLTMALEILKS